MKVDLKSYNNRWFVAELGGSPLKRGLWYLTNELVFSNGLFPFSRLKVLLLRLFGANVGQSVVIKPRVRIKYPWKLSIGDNSWVGEDVWIDNLTKVDIGSNVCLSQGAFLLTGNHDFSKTTFDLMVKNIVLEDGVWIGAQAIVCPGIVCRTHSVLTTRSVASRDLEPYKVHSGNPAIPVKERIIS
ncbi:WcaF family extracellular polysaccharide biosynthesis acetyltransferase [Flavihumibacter solisilvae]|uniref:Acyl transferase n=1 Tax=Flavihumibacter solisilvae TaxID=1349421 RepID=A0A0C1L3P6_9BACT|nr:WcaF family extracellular polysaccharide biosynthesis acetyltransferase [Flavihumibacter solisilvae]KIC94657.1 acyl transferase [Flavihumibacter solisilvae]